MPNPFQFAQEVDPTPKTKVNLDRNPFEFGKEDSTRLATPTGETQVSYNKTQYDEGYLPAFNDIDLYKARQQPLRDQLANAAVKFVPKVALDVLETAGDLVEFFDFDPDKSYTNKLTEIAKAGKQALDSSMPVLQETPSNEFAPLTDSGWWVNWGDGLLNSIASFGITGVGIGGALGKGAKAINGILNAGEKGLKVANGIAQLGTAGSLTYAEAVRSGADVYQNIKQDVLQNGYDYGDGIKISVPEEEAKRLASIGAAETVKDSFVGNLALNITSLSPIFKSYGHLDDDIKRELSRKIVNGQKESIGSYLKRLDEIEKTIAPKSAGGLKKFIAEGSQEYVEETNTLVAEKLGYNKILPDSKKRRLEDIYSDVVFSEEGAITGLSGFLGGLAQTAGLEYVPYKTIEDENGNKTRISNNQLEQREKELYKKETISTLKDDIQTIQNNQQALNTAVASGDKVAVEVARNNLFNVGVLKSLRTETAKELSETVANIAQVDNTEIRENGATDAMNQGLADNIDDNKYKQTAIKKANDVLLLNKEYRDLISNLEKPALATEVFKKRLNVYSYESALTDLQTDLQKSNVKLSQLIPNVNLLDAVKLKSEILAYDQAISYLNKQGKTEQAARVESESKIAKELYKQSLELTGATDEQVVANKGVYKELADNQTAELVLKQGLIDTKKVYNEALNDPEKESRELNKKIADLTKKAEEAQKVKEAEAVKVKREQDFQEAKAKEISNQVVDSPVVDNGTEDTLDNDTDISITLGEGEAKKDEIERRRQEELDNLFSQTQASTDKQLNTPVQKLSKEEINRNIETAKQQNKDLIEELEKEFKENTDNKASDEVWDKWDKKADELSYKLPQGVSFKITDGKVDLFDNQSYRESNFGGNRITQVSVASLHRQTEKFEVGDRIQVQDGVRALPAEVTKVNENGKILEAKTDDGRTIISKGNIVTTAPINDRLKINAKYDAELAALNENLPPIDVGVIQVESLTPITVTYLPLTEKERIQELNTIDANLINLDDLNNTSYGEHNKVSYLAQDYEKTKDKEGRTIYITLDPSIINDSYKILHDPEFNTGVDVVLKIDTEYQYYEKNKDSIKTIPIGVYYKGNFIGYLPVYRDQNKALFTIRSYVSEHKEVKTTVSKKTPGNLNISTKDFTSNNYVKTPTFVIGRGQQYEQGVDNVFKGKLVNKGSALSGVVYAVSKTTTGEYIALPVDPQKVGAELAESMQAILNLYFKGARKDTPASHTEEEQRLIKQLQDEYSIDPSTFKGLLEYFNLFYYGTNLNPETSEGQMNIEIIGRDFSRNNHYVEVSTRGIRYMKSGGIVEDYGRNDVQDTEKTARLVEHLTNAYARIDLDKINKDGEFKAPILNTKTPTYTRYTKASYNEYVSSVTKTNIKEVSIGNNKTTVLVQPTIYLDYSFMNTPKETLTPVTEEGQKVVSLASKKGADISLLDDFDDNEYQPKGENLTEEERREFQKKCLE